MNNNQNIINLAKLINNNKNIVPLGCSLAEVIEPLPNLKLKLLNGLMEIDHEIEGDQIYISDTLANRYDIDVTFKDYESKENRYEQGHNYNSIDYKQLKANGGKVTHPTPPPQAGNGSNGPVPPPIADALFTAGTIDDMKIGKHENKKENKEKGKMKMQTIVTLKKGEFVLVIPNSYNNQWFIIDIFKPLKKVELEWEYYQKS